MVKSGGEVAIEIFFLAVDADDAEWEVGVGCLVLAVLWRPCVVAEPCYWQIVEFISEFGGIVISEYAERGDVWGEGVGDLF